ncbi:glycosyltransferase family 4 protein [Candidatus Gracilibacteria bacterium]|nr:glycosyltransferase family 4 protein [Candidatus Gracilibacteria bacterium]
MGREKRIGIYFTSGSNWLGGVYYLINLVNSFNYSLKDEIELPHFVIFYNDKSERFIKLFEYPKISYIKLDELDNRKGFFKSLVLRKNYFYPKKIQEAKLNGLYPFNDFPAKINTKVKLISWYPDLQHKFYPEYFNKFKLWQREFRLKMLLKRSDHLVLSSQDVLSHFNQFYDLSKIKTSVLPFVSLTSKNDIVSIDILIKKYNIPTSYFIVSNQFYIHKDHITLFKALAVLRKTERQIMVLITGKMEDYRDPSYINQLKTLIEKEDLSSSIKLMGVIDRNDQLSLMKHSIAVIQPSLFEGWSTVVEDAKSLGVGIIASDIAIHKEQLDGQGVLFNHADSNSLASAMAKVIENPKMASVNFDYNKNIVDFTHQFEKLFSTQ